MWKKDFSFCYYEILSKYTTVCCVVCWQNERNASNYDIDKHGLWVNFNNEIKKLWCTSKCIINATGVTNTYLKLKQTNTSLIFFISSISRCYILSLIIVWRIYISHQIRYSQEVFKKANYERWKMKNRSIYHLYSRMIKILFFSNIF